MSSQRPTAPPFLLVASGASRLADPARRETLVAPRAAAIGARTGSGPEVRVTASPAAGRAAAREAIAAGASLVVVAGGDGSVRSTAAVLAGTRHRPRDRAGRNRATSWRPPSASRARPIGPIAALATARERPIDVGRAWVGLRAAVPTPFVVAAGRRLRRPGDGGHDGAAEALARDRGLLRHRDGRGRPDPPVRGAPRRRRRRPRDRRAGRPRRERRRARPGAPAAAPPARPRRRAARRPRRPRPRSRPAARGRRWSCSSVAASTRRSGPYARPVRRPSASRSTRPPGEPVEVDGDVVGGGGLVAEVVPGAVRVLVPA